MASLDHKMALAKNGFSSVKKIMPGSLSFYIHAPNIDLPIGLTPDRLLQYL